MYQKEQPRSKRSGKKRVKKGRESNRLQQLPAMRSNCPRYLPALASRTYHAAPPPPPTPGSPRTQYPTTGRGKKAPICCRRSSHEHAVALLGSLAGRLCLLDLGNHQLERLGDVGVVRGAGLGPAALQPLAQLAALLDADLALLRPQIALVTDDDDGDGLSALGRQMVSI